MLDKIKMLLARADDDSVDDLLQTLINLSKDEAVTYCNLDEYNEAMDFVIIQMVIERYNRIGSEGAISQKGSGISTDYYSFYSDRVQKMLNKFRKIKTV